MVIKWQQLWLAVSTGMLLLALSKGSRCSDMETPEPLNVLFILADDLGAHDVSCYGADLIETPCIDRFASQALLFRRAYSPAPVCTPTRASIMTGKHPARLKMTIWSEGAIEPPLNRPLIPGRSLPDLPLAETTLAEKFQAYGYITAMIGKWHLGDANHGPETQGFEVSIGGNHWGAPATFFYPYRGKRSNGEFRYLPGLGYGTPGEYLTDRLTNETIRTIEFAQKEGRPFFIALNHYAPHTPIEAKEEEERYFRQKMKPDLAHQNPGYAAMVKSLDSSVGKLWDYLEQKKLLQNTVFVFTSDNGGYIGVDGKRGTSVTSNRPLRSGKSSLYEGGIRVPLIVHWPQKNGMTQTCDQIVSLTDLHPTLLKATNSQQIAPQSTIEVEQDALEITGLLDAPQRTLPNRSLYFHYPHYYHAPETTPCSSILQYPWKLIYYYESDSTELYHLQQDPQESDDRSAQDTTKATELKNELMGWLQSIHAEIPSLPQNDP